MMDSFFTSLKNRAGQPGVYATHDHARADVLDYVERFYDRRRQHWTLGYLNPAAPEDAAASA